MTPIVQIGKLHCIANTAENCDTHNDSIVCTKSRVYLRFAYICCPDVVHFFDIYIYIYIDGVCYIPGRCVLHIWTSVTYLDGNISARHTSPGFLVVNWWNFISWLVELWKPVTQLAIPYDLQKSNFTHLKPRNRIVPALHVSEAKRGPDIGYRLSVKSLNGIISLWISSCICIVSYWVALYRQHYGKLGSFI